MRGLFGEAPQVMGCRGQKSLLPRPAQPAQLEPAQSNAARINGRPPSLSILRTWFWRHDGWSPDGSGDEKGANQLACLTFGLNFTIPPDAYQLGEAAGAVLVALVHAHRERHVRMPRIDSHHREPDARSILLWDG